MATIVSPLPGIFYRKPGPGKPPFANEGDTIEVGQTLGIVE
ncbi:MAG: acetyl-CoA carboxylase biotin carboxyl carrier protein subunit, partial [Arthrobacter sp.]|nr:acetyl-CoA carboxylase biotin carboxyl carrier protein subunit [Arthrobacter sp.]MCU1554960.1 acetyl-CoA carboxylase biotin carboxyl carrier protein subunit [Arthrobacter sp.]